MPFVFVGIAAWGRSTRLPVALVGSGLVKRLLGNGSRQGSANGWQSAAGVAAAAAPGATSTPRIAKRTIAVSGRVARAASSHFANPLISPPSLASSRRRSLLPGTGFGTSIPSAGAPKHGRSVQVRPVASPDVPDRDDRPGPAGAAALARAGRRGDGDRRGGRRGRVLDPLSAPLPDRDRRRGV